MSFAYLPLYTGDYLRDTRHLSPLKHGIYLLLLMHCWDQKGPLPLDEQEAAGIANCRSTDEIDALRYVLERYFIRMDDGFYNKRMADEVARAERLSRTFHEAGLRSAEARRNKARAGAGAKAEARLNLGSTDPEPRLVPPSPSPSLETSTSNPFAPSRREKPRRTEPKSPKLIGHGALIAVIPAIGGDCWINESAVAEWQDTYPDCDVPATLKEIRSWLAANPTKRKSNVARFVNAWLKREQDRG